MANDPASGWTPDWAVIPGEILLETLQDRGMTQSELARRMARPPKTINEIIKGKAAITAETAIQLERTLGIPAAFWTNLESRYRDHLARREALRELEANASWANDFPLKDLRRHHLISAGATKAAVLAELLSFFRISSPDAFDRHWLDPSAAFRSSPAFMSSPKAVAAWLRWGEIEAERLGHLPPFDSRGLRRVLDAVRPLTRRAPFAHIVQQAKTLCLETGVIMLVTPEFEGTHLSGATHWNQGHPIIQLSLRHNSNDHFWFTFFHEAAHVLISPKRREFVDADFDMTTDPDEIAANQLARDLLLPRDAYQAFVGAGNFMPDAVRAFAEEQSVAPGIVVGRLQHDKAVPRTHLNDLKRPLR